MERFRATIVNSFTESSQRACTPSLLVNIDIVEFGLSNINSCKRVTSEGIRFILSKTARHLNRLEKLAVYVA